MVRLSNTAAVSGPNLVTHTDSGTTRTNHENKNPVVASLSSSSVGVGGGGGGKPKTTAAIVHPSYNSIALSPGREYAVIACKDTLQLIQINADGLHLLKTIAAAPYFQQQQPSNHHPDHKSNNNNKNNNSNNNVTVTTNPFHHRGGWSGQPQQQQHQPPSIDTSGLLNLRDFALGGGSSSTIATTTRPSSSTTTTTTTAANAMIDVVITDVAWSSGKSSPPPQPQPRTADRNSSNRNDPNHDVLMDDGKGMDHYRDTDSESSKEQQQQQEQQRLLLRSSMIAAAGSNGIIVVWNTETLLHLDTTTSTRSNDTSTQKKFSSHKTPTTSTPAAYPPTAILNQHIRQVNRLAWHPTRDGILLSASQDWTVVLWERRKKQNPVTIIQNQPKATTTSNNIRTASSIHQQPRMHSFFGAFVSATSSQPQKQQQHSRPHEQQQQHKPPTVEYQWHCRTTFAPKSEAVRDIQWSPFYDDGKRIIQCSLYAKCRVLQTVTLTLPFVFVYIFMNKYYSFCFSDNEWLIDCLQSICCGPCYR
jgi:hypothetical protein